MVGKKFTILLGVLALSLFLVGVVSACEANCGTDDTGWLHVKSPHTVSGGNTGEDSRGALYIDEGTGFVTIKLPELNYSGQHNFMIKYYIGKSNNGEDDGTENFTITSGSQTYEIVDSKDYKSEDERVISTVVLDLSSNDEVTFRSTGKGSVHLFLFKITGEKACSPFCGDGECNGDEDCESCPEDCGTCPEECTVTVLKPVSGWYGSSVPIEWTASQECLSDEWDLTYKKGSCNPSGAGWEGFAYTVLSPQVLDAILHDLIEGSQYCIKVEGDNHGNEVGFSDLFKVDLTPPAITSSDITCDEGETINLTASATDALSGVNESTWKWQLPGGTIIYDNESTYTCGSYDSTAIVNISDNVGNEATKEITINVNEQPEEPKETSHSNGNILEYKECISDWECSGWSECSNGVMTRTCEDANRCEIAINEPSLTTDCIEPITRNSKVKNNTNNLLFFAGIILLIVLLIILVNLRG